MAGIFKSYDIRGVYSEELDEDRARAIGTATGNFFGEGTVLAGNDMREVAEPIAEALVEGLNRAGNDVLDIGLCSTPMNYRAIGHFNCVGGVMVTASHNPPEYIGFKLSREEARPVSYETGIGSVEDAVEEGSLRMGETEGTYEQRDFLDQYVQDLLDGTGELDRLNVAVDAGNGMAGLTVPPLLDELPVEYNGLYMDLDGTFPNHPPNPVEEENLDELRTFMQEGEADLGVAFDGDADRAVFLDERGAVIPADLMTALLARKALRNHPGEAILYDLRSSRVVPEVIEENGGEPVRYRVGHAYMKEKMREEDAVFGGELSGHYYYRKNYYTDSAPLALLDLMELLSEKNTPLSELIEPLRRYHQSGEINFSVDDQQGAMEILKEKFSDGEIDHLDGVTVQFNDWWFNVRPSNTEPLLRLNLEAEDESLMNEKVQRVRTIIQNNG
jgi:phosphomannomutase